MLAYSTVKPVLDRLLDTELVQKIYHSVRISDTSGDRFPVYRLGDEWLYCGQDDTKIMGCYIRQTGDLISTGTTPVSSSEKFYNARVPYRIVLFNDYEKRDHADIAAQLMNIVFYTDIEFVRYISDKSALAIQESQIRGFEFGGDTFYAAIDILVNFKLKLSNCEQVMNCGELPNPIVKI